MQAASFGPNLENSELERIRREVQQLESLRADLKEELRTKRPFESKPYDWEEEKIDSEIALHKAHARVEALESEVTHKGTEFAQEIARLKLMLTDKEAQLENMILPRPNEEKGGAFEFNYRDNF